MMKLYIGIDVGTTSLKALALTEKGECVATAKSSYELFANGAFCAVSGLRKQIFT